jgi:hypothetical protein
LYVILDVFSSLIPHIDAFSFSGFLPHICASPR